MAICTLPLLSVFVLFVLITCAAQPPFSNGTDFSCSVDTTHCNTYVVYRARSPDFLDLRKIADLFAVSPQQIARSSNLDSEEAKLSSGQLLFIPISCDCTGNRSFANITYRIKPGDSFFLVSTTSFQFLTNYEVVEELNPNLSPTNLSVGTEVVFPLFCKCPKKADLYRINKLISYVLQPGDNALVLSARFWTSVDEIETENNHVDFRAAVYQPIVIPVTDLPVLTQPTTLSKQRNQTKKHLIVLITSCTVGAVSTLLLICLLVYVRYSSKKKKTLNRNDSSLEMSDLIQMKKPCKEDLGNKNVHDKLLPGLSGYLGAPIVYEFKNISDATMNFTDCYRIGGSVYKAMINGKMVAVKKFKEDVTEELKILQKVSHANLIQLLGVSSEPEGSQCLVYEFAENGSLDKWLYSKPTSSIFKAFLSWNQRLQIALDVAHGLQYMHEHTQPSIVHRDIRTRNVLLDSSFRAKIANFSTARPAMTSAAHKVDVFSFGVILLELLSGRKAMETKENGEIVMIWKELKGILENTGAREERLKLWMDIDLQNCYPLYGALILAVLAEACTSEKPSARPSMTEVVFNLSVLAHTTSETLERSSWAYGLEADEPPTFIKPVTAR